MVYAGLPDQSKQGILLPDPGTVEQVPEMHSWLPDDGPCPIWLAWAVHNHLWLEWAPIGCREFCQKPRVATSTVGVPLERGRRGILGAHTICVEMTKPDKEDQPFHERGCTENHCTEGTDIIGESKLKGTARVAEGKVH